MQSAAVQLGEKPFCCDCPDHLSKCSESADLHRFMLYYMPNFDDVFDRLRREDDIAIAAGRGIIDDTWRSKIRDLAPDIVKAYSAGFQIPDDYPMLTDPECRRPHISAPNHDIISGGPFGHAPSLINTSYVYEDVEPEFVMEPALFEEFIAFLKDEREIGQGESFGDWYRKQFCIVHKYVTQLNVYLNQWEKHHGTTSGVQWLRFAPSDVLSHHSSNSRQELQDVVTVNLKCYTCAIQRYGMID